MSILIIKKLQIADFALYCLKISFKSKISLQITDFSQGRHNRGVIGFATSLVLKRGVATRTPLIMS